MNKLTHLIYLSVSYKLNLYEPLNPPYQFSIEPTNSCNYKCVFCPQSSPGHALNRKQGSLSPKNLRIFLEKIRPVRSGNKNISLTLDGEPTLNKDLPEFIRLINDEGLLPRFSTNARNLDQNLADKLVASGAFLASIDFASDAKYYDGIRGKEGDFEIVLENIRYVVNIARKTPDIRLEIVNISHSSGADPGKTLFDMRKLFPDDLPGNISFRSREFHNFCGHLNTDTGDKYSLCPYPWTSFTVTWEGDVVPCCRDTSARTILGNVFNQTIMEIWHGEKYRSLRKNLANRNSGSIKACKQCDLPWSKGSSRWKIKYMTSSLLQR